MLVAHDARFVLLEVPRTASRSMNKACRQISSNYRQYNHHRMQLPPGVADYYIFACVRNPYAREYSHYRYRKSNRRNNMYKLVRDWSFETYLRWSTNPGARPLAPHDRPQAQLLAGKPLSCVLKFEDLPHAFYQLPFVPAGFTLPHVNAASNSKDSWKTAYTPELADLVYTWATEDFDLYGYSPLSYA